MIRLDEGEFADVDLFTKQRLDLELSALPESDYFARIAAFYAPVRGMTWVTALLIATGARMMPIRMMTGPVTCGGRIL